MTPLGFGTTLVSPAYVLAGVTPLLLLAVAAAGICAAAGSPRVRTIAYAVSLASLALFVGPLLITYPDFRGRPHLEGAWIFLMRKPALALAVYLGVAFVLLAPLISRIARRPPAVRWRWTAGLSAGLLATALALSVATLPVWNPDFVVDHSPRAGPLVRLWCHRYNERALRRLNTDFRDEALKRFSRLLKHPDPLVSSQAGRGLAALGPDGERVLRCELTNPDRDARWTALLQLGALGAGARAAVPDIIGVLNDPDHNLRRDAAEVLGRIGPDARAAVPHLIAALRKDPEPTVRHFAAEAIGAIDTETAPALAALIDGLSDPSWDVRYYCARALGAGVGSAAGALPALRRAMNDEEQQVREAAAGAIAAIETGGRPGDDERPGE